MTAASLLPMVKKNLVIEHNADDELLTRLCVVAIDYAEKFQHLTPSYYSFNDPSSLTVQAMVMFASHLYESRDGSTGGFFNDSALAGTTARATINNLLRIEKDWKV